MSPLELVQASGVGVARQHLNIARRADLRAVTADDERDVVADRKNRATFQGKASQHPLADRGHSRQLLPLVAVVEDQQETARTGRHATLAH